MKKFVWTVLFIALSLFLVACGASSSSQDSSLPTVIVQTATELPTVTVASVQCDNGGHANFGSLVNGETVSMPRDCFYALFSAPSDQQFADVGENAVTKVNARTLRVGTKHSTVTLTITQGSVDFAAVTADGFLYVRIPDASASTTINVRW